MTDDDKALVERLRSNRPLPTLPHEAADRIEALSAEVERIKYDLRQALRNASKSAPGFRIRILTDGIRAALGEQQ